MRNFLKVLLPPFAGFLFYFLLVRYSSHYFELRTDEMGKGGLLGFMAYYRYLLPLLFIVAVLTQLLLVIPIWREVIEKSTTTKIIESISLVFICLVFAAGISYAIWDRQDGVNHLLVQIAFMTVVQLAYWLINLYILKLLK